MERSKPEIGNIIYSNIGTLGNTVFVEADAEYSIKNVALFKPASLSSSYYLYLRFRDNSNLERMQQLALGTSQKFFSLNFLRNLDIIVPPIDVLNKFAHIIEPIIQLRSILNKQRQILQQSRDFVLPKLISGKIDVNELDIDTGEET